MTLGPPGPRGRRRVDAPGPLPAKLFAKRDVLGLEILDVLPLLAAPPASKHEQEELNRERQHGLDASQWRQIRSLGPIAVISHLLETSRVFRRRSIGIIREERRSPTRYVSAPAEISICQDGRPPT